MTTVHTYTHIHTHTSLIQCSSESRASVHVQEPPLKPQQITHTVKLINKARKKEYKIEKLGSIPFSSLESIKTALKDRGGNVSDGIGYIEPGHGLNGKQKWLLDDDDVSEMYAVHKKSRELMLYAYVNVSGGGGESSASVIRGKHPKEKPPKEAPPPKRGSTITQVEAIMAELKETHGSKFDAAKYACWAHCIQNGKHSSMDAPPDLPFFTGRKKSGSQCDSPSTTTSSGSRSPTKRLNLRTECIDQLSKWHSLLQGGAISQDQYDEMKDTIMEDMKSMK